MDVEGRFLMFDGTWFYAFFFSGGRPFRSSRIVPTMVMFLSKHHWANGIEIKYLSIEMLQPDMMELVEEPLTRYLVYLSVHAI